MKSIGLLLAALFAAASAFAQMTEMPSIVGKSFPLPKELSELKGSPALIEFWATWCPPCVESVPHLNAISNKYKPKGLRVVGVTNDPPEAIERFIKKVPIDYAVVLDPNNVLVQSLGAVEVMTIPYAYLLNRSGKVVWQGRPMELTSEEIEKVL